MKLDGTVRVICGALVIAAVMAPLEAFACSCARSGTPCAAFEQPEAVIFVGTAIEVLRPEAPPSNAPAGSGSRNLRVRFSVDEALHGAGSATAIVNTADNGGECGYPFEAGESYLVYAFRAADGLHTSICLRTGPLTDKRNDLELLREAASGEIRSRLFGTVVFLQSRLNGSLIPGVAGALPDVKVVASNANGKHEVVTDATGVFRFTGLAPGQYSVRADVAAPLKAAFEAGETVQLDACSAEVDLLLTTESLKGTVHRHDGSPGPRDVQVTVVDVQHMSPARSAIAFTRPDGRWSIEGLPDGRYLVGVNAFRAPTAASPYPTVWYPGVPDPGKAQEIAFLDGRTRQLDLTLPPPLRLRTIRGVVLDAQGRPAAGANVSLFDREFPAQDVGAASTDAEGRFSIAAVVERRVSVRARLNARGGGVESDTTDVPDTPEGAALTLTLWKPLPAPR